MDNTIRTDRRFAIIDEWVLNLDISDRALRLYAILMRYADNETHKAFPSRRTLAERLRCSPASVDRAISELVQAGALSKEQRFNSSLIFTIHTYPNEVGSPVTRGVITDDEGGSSPVMRGVVSGDDLTRTTELEPVNKNQLTNEFEIFWSIYPRRTGKQAARASFEKAVKSVGLDKVMDGVRALAEDPNLPEEKFIPNPATWLNQGRWDDDPYPAKHSDRKPTAAERTAQLIHGARARDEEELITKGIGQGPDFGYTLKGIDG